MYKPIINPDFTKDPGRYTLSDNEALTHGYMNEYYDILNDKDYIEIFMRKREMSGLTFQTTDGVHWSEFEDWEKLILAVSVLDCEAVNLFKISGGIH